MFTDADMPNRMDEKPFLVFDLLDIDRTLLPELQKLSKESFDLESVVSAAEALKFVSGIRRIIAAEVKEPSDEWIRFFVSRLYEGRTTQRIIDQFRPLVTKALNQYIGDQVNTRLKTALGDDARTMCRPLRRSRHSLLCRPAMQTLAWGSAIPLCRTGLA